MLEPLSVESGASEGTSGGGATRTRGRGRPGPAPRRRESRGRSARTARLALPACAAEDTFGDAAEAVDVGRTIVGVDEGAGKGGESVAAVAPAVGPASGSGGIDSDVPSGAVGSC
jgi:hypothetical protein